MDFDLFDAVVKIMTEKGPDQAALFVERKMRALESDLFKGSIDNRFTNDPADIGRVIGRFVQKSREALGGELRAVYLEMNGFDINPDLWFFDLFGYTRYGDDPKDLEWLSDWDTESDPNESVTLTGLEAVQKDFERYGKLSGYEKTAAVTACDHALMLVMLRFVQLIDKAVKSMEPPCTVPALATAHDFEAVHRILPR